MFHTLPAIVQYINTGYSKYKLIVVCIFPEN